MSRRDLYSCIFFPRFNRLLIEMNWKERIINTIKGRTVDYLPFIPRLDLWYKSNKLNKTLPTKYRDCTLKEIYKDLGTGFHSVIPDFRNFMNDKSISLQGLGIYDIKSNPYKIVTDGIDINFKTDDEGLTTTLFNTPYGKITTQVLFNKKMESDGASLGHTTEHAMKSINDLKSLGYIFENIKVEENIKNFEEFSEQTGDDGVCVAFSMLSGSPMHHIMKELMSFEDFVFVLNDNKEEIEKLSQKIVIFFEKVLSACLKSKSDIIFLGANYDNFLTWPLFFKEYITSYLKDTSYRVHEGGKYLLTHTDGENKGLIQEYIDSEIDIADSICPYPMTSLNLRDIREKFGDKITIWGGLPSICVLEESMSDYEFEKFIDKFFNDLKDGKNIILSFADTTPPGAKFERIEKVSKLSKSFLF